MSYVEILHANGLTQQAWDNRLFREYLGMLFWRHLMGTSTNAVIQLKDETKTTGDAITIGMRGHLVGGHITGTTKGRGNEGTVAFYNQKITIDNVADLVKFEDVPLSQKRVGFGLLNEGREALEEAAKYRLEDDITAAVTDVTQGRVRGRYLYGATDTNWNATHATALQSVDNTADQLSTSIIDIAKRKATIPINAEVKVRPMRVKIAMNWEEWFILVAHTYPIRDLVNNDAAWRNTKLNLTPRTTDATEIYNGQSFKGSWNGVLVYEYERMPLIASTIQVAQAELMGAQAAAVVWGQRAKFNEEWHNFEHDVSYELHEIRGIQPLVFNRTTPEDNGKVSVFTAAVAD